MENIQTSRKAIAMIEYYLLSWLILVIWILLTSYALFTLALTFLWNRIKPASKSIDTSGVSISVIIPVRNEAANIEFLLKDLASQTLPFSQFEVLVMDDGSTDDTAQIVRNFALKTECEIRVIALPDTKTSSPKKRAIETAISQAKGNLIVTTDGDCRAKPGWLLAIAQYHQATGAKLISSPVTFTQETSLPDHLQTVEFASLIGSGASAISAGYPSLCNGANLAYEKQAFIEVDGFEGVKHIASGDDEFLMHKIAARFPNGVFFLKNPDAVVSTGAHKRWADFFRQRKRWASKWKHYKSRTPLVLALYVFSCNFSLIFSIILWLSGSLNATAFVTLLALKFIPEWFFLGSVLRFLGKSKSIPYIVVTQLIYSFYVCFFGLAAQKSEYEWKGRKLV